MKPFTHIPGTPLLIPGTHDVVQLYPQGNPARDFTAELNLKQGEIRVWGKGYKEIISAKGEAPTEELSLGSHKKQDWDLMIRRLDLREFLPLWLRLGQWTPPVPIDSGPSLLQKALEASHEEIYQALVDLLRTGFTGIFVPTAEDLHRWGYPLPPVTGNLFQLLTEGAKLIRALFFQEEESLCFLPKLAPQFHCGKMTGLKWSLGTLDFEWSRKKLRKVTLVCEKSGKVLCHFPKSLKCFRVRKKEQLDVDTPFDVSSGEIVLLDRFEK